METGFPLFPEQASTVAFEVDLLYFFLVAVTVFFSLLISGLIIYFSIRYRRRSDVELPEPITGSTKLETLWTAIPALIVIVVFVWSAKIYFTLTKPPQDALPIYVVGKQWMWKLQHLEGQREINHLHVPMNRSIKLVMTSEDVIHSFYVPAFRIKKDVLPGRYTTAWFKATKPGTYHLFCAEYCGTEHSKMGGSVTVMEPLDYQRWLSGEQAGESLATRGERLFRSLACHTCHRPDGLGRGPSLQLLYGMPVKLQTGETVLADENYLRQSILNPRAKVVVGYRPVMPTFQGQVSEEQLLQILAYLRSIGSESQPESPPTVNPN